MSVKSSLQTSVTDGVKVGVLATLTMDAVLLASARLGGDRMASPYVSPELVGRWASRLCRLRSARDLASLPPERREALVGIGVHYLTGVTLTWIYLEAARRSGRGGNVPAAAAYGAATALLPFVIMYPSWGLGLMARRSGEAGKLLGLMLLGHTTFGAAIGMWAAVLGAGGRSE
jgi:Protein of unknown function (DUF2938)